MRNARKQRDRQRMWTSAHNIAMRQRRSLALLDARIATMKLGDVEHATVAARETAITGDMIDLHERWLRGEVTP